MKKSKTLVHLTGLLMLASLAMMGCEGKAGPAGPAGPLADASGLTCTACHESGNLITAKQAAWSESGHGTGTAYSRGSSASCAGCHSGAAAEARITAGMGPNEVTAGDPSPTRQDCRTCHKIHTTFTEADFALTSTAAVPLYAIAAGATYDGGAGNLCVECHQPRREFPAAVDGVITGITSHWGPHHGPQSAMLLGVAGAGVTGSSSTHYRIVEDTCVLCHMGEDKDHHYEAEVANCVACHADADNFDINGVQTEVEAMVDELGEKLLAAGLINENSADGHAIVTEAPEAQATALYNWIYVSHEDGSKGVHNPDYTKALLQKGLDEMQ